MQCNEVTLITNSHGLTTQGAQMALLHETGDLVHLKVKDIKTIEELPKLTEKPLEKEKMRW
jgi:hypothetical protein